MTRNDTIAFLRCVLPPEGYYCAVIFDTANPRPGIDRPRHQFCSTIEDLADVILTADQQGKTVYHACASFKEPSRRTQQNALLARSLWADIDTREGKSPKAVYADRQEAAEQVVAFCLRNRLPVPVFVDSGFGLHCYWPLEQSLAADEWRTVATAFKALCARDNLAIDTSRAADIASILRTPGTTNRKDGEHLVRDDGSRPAHSNATFAGLAGSQVTGTHRVRPAVRENPARSPIVERTGRRSISASIESGNTYGAVYADDVADRCAQIDALRQSGSVHGWFLRTSVLAFCADGEVKAHEWSANDYPGYDFRVVDDRLRRARSLSGATTCERLHALDPATCERCPLWGKINSPISVPSGPASNGVQRSILPAGVSGGHEITVAGLRLPALPSGFKWTGQALTHVKEDENGEQTETIIARHPIFLAAVQTGELDNSAFSYRFRKFLPLEGWSDVVIDAKALHGNGGIADMFGKGAVIHEPKFFLNYARHAVDDFHKETETRVRYDQFGWKNDNSSFLFGKMLYTGAGPVEAIGAKEVETRSQWIGPKPRGNVEAWTEAADALFASDMEAYSAMVLASFAAPLMRFQSQDEGGAILHLFTPGSGQGKTTALNAAWSVWGTKEGLALTNEDTRVSKPIAIGTLANLPVIYDELRDKDPEYIRRMVVMFTEGRDRMRGMVDGTIRHTKANWQTIMLSAANNSLIDQLQGDGVDAPAFRVLEMSSTLSQKIDKTKGDRLKRILNENAGHAGDAYLRYLLHPPVLEFARTSLERWTQDIWDVTRLDSAHRFRVRAVGAIAVASALVNKLGILHFQTDRIVEWLVRELGTGKNSGTVSSAVPIDYAINGFGEFINEHLGEMIVVRHEWRPRKEKQIPLMKPQHRLSIRYEIEPQRVFVSESVFRDWAAKKQMPSRTVLDMLEKHGVITARKRGVTLSAGTDIPGAQVACIEVNASHPVMSGLVASVTELQDVSVLQRN